MIDIENKLVVLDEGVVMSYSSQGIFFTTDTLEEDEMEQIGIYLTVSEVLDFYKAIKETIESGGTDIKWNDVTIRIPNIKDMAYFVVLYAQYINRISSELDIALLYMKENNINVDIGESEDGQNFKISIGDKE